MSQGFEGIRVAVALEANLRTAEFLGISVAEVASQLAAARAMFNVADATS
ncbi:hypothetical protein BN2476_110014 [Paraburkholderia piptadeniae]|uniref:Uncharacterized protein n=1 Tax=Paraburkholderia piptadeniae TaxID=1701573 RepID=A0A1N7RP81_9BURK|nr:hypothetical protein [Paraburkholderia piptadeniae]SIT36931.1 hypothetical protein BN2476_110014 [Paraburkholderia piptadeniae]